MSFLLVLLLIVVAIGVIHLWASNSFYLTRKQTSFVCFLAFLLGLAAFLVGWFQREDSHLLFYILRRGETYPTDTSIPYMFISQIKHLLEHLLVILPSCFWSLEEH